MAEKSSLLRGTLITSAVTMLSRVLGFVREILTARLLGAGFYSDAYFAAFRIPNLLRSFVAEGALSSAFVPIFAAELKRGHAQAADALRILSGFLICLSAVLSAAGIFFAPQLTSLFEFSGEKAALCAELTRTMMPYLVFISIVAMINGALNSVHIYGAAGWAQVATNIMLIAGAAAGFLVGQEEAVRLLAWSLVAGGLTGAWIQLPALRRAGLSMRPLFRIGDPLVRQLLRLMLPAVFGAAIYQCTMLLSTSFASYLEEGSISWLYYADRIAQLPVGVFTVALASVLLPALSRAHAESNSNDFSRQLGQALGATSVVMVPVAAALALFAAELVELFYQGGAFSATSAARSADALQAMSFGLWAASCHSVAVRAFIARRDTVTPTLLGMASLMVFSLLALLMMGPIDPQKSATLAQLQVILTSALPHADFGHVGLALSSSSAACLVLLVLSAVLLRRERGLSLSQPIRSTILAVIATIPGCAITLWIGQLGLGGLSVLVIGGLAYAGSFLVAAKLLKIKEVEVIVGRVLRKLRRGE